MANATKVKVPSAAISPEVAARTFDEERWAAFVRLRCVEIAAQRAINSEQAFSAEAVLGLAKPLVDYVDKGG